MVRRVLLHMFVTIDGVAEMPDYGESPAPGGPNEEEPVWLPDLDSIDTLLFGRKTYLLWAAHWPPRKDDPAANEFERRFSRFADRAEKVVFSATLDRAEWPNSRIVRMDLSAEVGRIRSAPGGDIAVGGGPRLSQSLLSRNLVDELFLTVFPSIVRRGKPLFDVERTPDNPADVIPLGAPGRTDFELLAARPRRDGIVSLHYRRVPAVGNSP